MLITATMSLLEESSPRDIDRKAATTASEPLSTSHVREPAFRRLLVPLDGSILAEAVLPFVRRLTTPQSASIVVLRVVTPTPIAAIDVPMAAQAVVEMDERNRVESERYVENVAAELHADGFDVITDVRIGEPAHVILECVRDRAIELIAMTTHGRTGLRRLLFGSVAEHVLRHAPVPVFLVRVSGAEEMREAA
jgi:nucleotide-binding universal stress UspA family protein